MHSKIAEIILRVQSNYEPIDLQQDLHAINSNYGSSVHYTVLFTDSHAKYFGYSLPSQLLAFLGCCCVTILYRPNCNDERGFRLRSTLNVLMGAIVILACIRPVLCGIRLFLLLILRSLNLYMSTHTIT